MTIISVTGTRPQLVKASAMSRALRGRHAEIVVHTGQHYDPALSQIFFAELEVPEPAVNLGVGSGSHGQQTAAMLAGLDPVLGEIRPDWVLVFGDTNSALAAALVAAKLHLRIAHVEAGLRSYNRAMPEEVNRVVIDHLSTLLCCPSPSAAAHLAAEGVVRGVHVVGDVMGDALAHARARLGAEPMVLDRLGLTPGGYVVATVHRAENTDDGDRLRAILAALDAISGPVLFPVHPRTAAAMTGLARRPSAHVRLLDPLGYLDMIALMSRARLVLTDSGGLQKEAYWLGVPCITLRQETEWDETVDAGWNQLVGADTDRIVAAVRTMRPPDERPALYGDLGAADRCVDLLERLHGS